MRPKKREVRVRWAKGTNIWENELTSPEHEAQKMMEPGVSIWCKQASPSIRVAGRQAVCGG